MAESFWKTLGSTLVDAGAAYLQQVRLVEELKRLSTGDALARFPTYVQGLTAPRGRASQVTLAVLENTERSADAKHVIASPRAALAGRQSPPALSADASSAAATRPGRTVAGCSHAGGLDSGEIDTGKTAPGCRAATGRGALDFRG